MRWSEYLRLEKGTPLQSREKLYARRFFFVQSTNLAEITCVIFDRWGVKMYDVSSSTGNISWDGKTLFGKDTPSGTYFYILKASGKDGNTFEEKGSLSLYR